MIRSEHPDLVLMDVMMPHVDGLEACQAIKQDPSTRLTPVVLVTSLDDSASRIRGIEAGADDFVSKPFNAPELLADDDPRSHDLQDIHRAATAARDQLGRLFPGGRA